MNNIPIELKPYLLEISERLWTGHASVMIGAGFSKNATNNVNNNKGLPSWNELGDIFYEKIHGQKPDGKTPYLNPLKLADEVQAAFGRSVLDQLLKKHVGDKDFEPSDTHVKLLELPWSDVFTTNYDTLLERSCENVISRRYDIVINQKDIVHSSRPRIIKLHGSFPSERPLIITEEDYRTYPKKFAPLVNTVQQSLLENTLCLLGFSGDDPNFLQWIGWINDNIGKENSPKIYLLGMLKISEAQRKLMASKNIIALDLSKCNGIDDHKKAMNFFVDFLHSQRKRRENINWPIKQKVLSPSDSVPPSSIIDGWKNTRLNYPNWIVLPQEQREKLWTFTGSFAADEKIFERLQIFEDIDYAYELNWRLEKCLFPIYNNIAPLLQNILDKYNPFPGVLMERTHNCFTEYTRPGGDWTSVRFKWITLSLSLLRFYREEDLKELWVNTHDCILKIVGHLSSEQIALFYYERILKAVFSSDTDLAKELLSEWPINSSIPYWEAKRACLLSEFGQRSEAEKTLEEALTTIRKRLNLSPIEDDYTWVSNEAYVMFLLRLIRSNNQNYNDTNSSNAQFVERWNSLLYYKCDPWSEKKYFDLMLQQEYNGPKIESRKYEFEIGSITTSYHFGRDTNDSFIAYTFLRFIEEIGIPLSLQHSSFNAKTINGMLLRIMPASPKWGLSIMNRYRDSKSIEYVFDRPFLAKTDYQDVDEYVSYYLDKFYQLYPERNENAFANAFVNKVPGILSRLCVKASDSSIIKMFEFYQIISKDEIIFPDSKKLMINLIDGCNSELLYKVIPLLLETPVLNERSSTSQINYPEPFNFINKTKVDPKINLSSKVINRLIHDAGSASNCRLNASIRLVFLYRNNLLNKSQIDKLFTAFWEKTDENTGFPVKTGLYNYEYISLPAPPSIDTQQLYATYIERENFNIQGKERGIGMGRGRDQYADEILNGSFSIYNNKGINWKEIEFRAILLKIEYWWESDKTYLIGAQYKAPGFGHSVHQEFQQRFKKLKHIIARVFGGQKNVLMNKDILKKIKALINDMHEHGLPVLEAKGVFGDLMYASHLEYLEELQIALSSSDRMRVVDALDSLTSIMIANPFSKQRDFIPRVVEILIQPIRWRIRKVLSDCLTVINNLIESRRIDLPSVEKPLLNTLEWLISKNNIGHENNDLMLKRKAVLIAGTIYREYSEKGIEIPIVIQKWKEVVNNPNEFRDVVNRWY